MSLFKPSQQKGNLVCWGSLCFSTRNQNVKDCSWSRSAVSSYAHGLLVILCCRHTDRANGHSVLKSQPSMLLCNVAWCQCQLCDTQAAFVLSCGVRKRPWEPASSVLVLVQSSGRGLSHQKLLFIKALYSMEWLGQLCSVHKSVLHFYLPVTKTNKLS